MSSLTRTWWLRSIFGAGLLLAPSGCDRNEVQTYRLAKDAPAAVSPPDQAVPAPDVVPPAGHPRLSWTLPAGWKEMPAAEMRAASFAVPGPDGQSADVSVIPLPSGAPELDLVNMWREQLQLAPVTGGAAARDAQPVKIGSDAGKLYDLVSDKPVDGGANKRIVVGMTTRGAMSWFFKMTGEASFVEQQKPAFVQFLKSISIQEAGGEAASFADSQQFLSTNARQAPSENTEKPIWVVPPGWQEAPPSQFLLAKFEITEADAKAEVNVSMLGGSGGGLLANVNRWRRQLGLTPVDDDAMSKQIVEMDGDGGKVLLVDLTGADAKSSQPARLVGAVAAQGGQTWFYKLMGNPQLVERQKDTFTKFVQTVKYSHAP